MECKHLYLEYYEPQSQSGGAPNITAWCRLKKEGKIYTGIPHPYTCPYFYSNKNYIDCPHFNE